MITDGENCFPIAMVVTFCMICSSTPFFLFDCKELNMESKKLLFAMRLQILYLFPDV